MNGGADRSPDDAASTRIALVRGLAAIAWALLLFAVGGGFSTLAKVLVAAYPAIDIVASLLAARASHGTSDGGERRSAATSLLAIVALAVACASGRDAVSIVFGVWAAVSGQLQVREARKGGGAVGGRNYGLLSGSLSTAIGAILVVLGAAGHGNLRLIAAYILVGGLLYVLSASRRRGAPAG